MENEFWDYLDRLVQSSQLVIDRPKGSSHPRFPKSVHQRDYGYLRNTSSGDMKELDVWKGSIPDKSIEEIICSLDLNKNDLEIKVLIGCSSGEVQTILNFQNSENMRAILIRRQKEY